MLTDMQRLINTIERGDFDLAARMIERELNADATTCRYPVKLGLAACALVQHLPITAVGLVELAYSG